MTGQQRVALSETLGRVTHPKEVVAAHAQVLEGSAAQSRYLEVTGGRRIHAIETGVGKPLVLLHGSGPTALQFLPLIERIKGVRAIAVDRPGFGLSDPIEREPGVYREAAVESLTMILDRLELDETALLGNSTGGTWALWYALAHPGRVTRLVLLGAPPLFPGARVPPPMLGVAAPNAGPPPEMPQPSTETVIQSMSVFGEGETIARYRDQLDAMVAAGSDQLAAGVRLTELRALIAPTGWQPALATRPEELQEVTVPTLMIWGEQDPLGGADVARAAAATIPHAQLELLPAGHAPWLGHPDRVATMVSDFVG
ncbi:MAG: alpha/beta fold hydrolase [Candidatus Limnocylindria bacterium]